MTVTYTAEVATCSKCGCFLKLLWRWRGSIYKMVWRDLLIFLMLYYGISIIYRFLLSKEAQDTFESIVHYCATYSSLIPLSFVLGFYVLLVMTRWWEQYTMIPWPDSIAVFVSAHIHGHDERGRLMRRTIMRYVCLSLTIVFTMISPCVKKRFPNRTYLVEAGLLLENERKVLEGIDNAFPKTPKHWMPIVWACSIITRARYEGRIRDDIAVKTIIDELNNFRGRAGALTLYDFINVPLVYTQVVTIAVYSFFVCSLLAHQWTDARNNPFAIYEYSLPIFISMEFFFYMGWLKVAEILINPWGEDDDDFEVNWMIDRNLQVSYLIVDEMHHEHPELVKDQYWDDVSPAELPYDADAKREEHPRHSTAKYDTHLSPCPTQMESVTSHERLEQTLYKISEDFFEDEAESSRPRSHSSDQCLLDVESVTCLTSYRHSVPSEESFELKNEYLREETTLFSMPQVEQQLEMETEDEVVVKEDNDEWDEEEEECEDELSSNMEDIDLDIDPFETLRKERQLERVNRTSALMHRYFGSDFKILSSANLSISGYGSQFTVRSNVERLPLEQIQSGTQNHSFELDKVPSHLTQVGSTHTISEAPIPSTEIIASSVSSLHRTVKNSARDTEGH